MPTHVLCRIEQSKQIDHSQLARMGQRIDEHDSWLIRGNGNNHVVSTAPARDLDVQDW
jgi:hypothetical protein